MQWMRLLVLFEQHCRFRAYPQADIPVFALQILQHKPAIADCQFSFGRQ